MHRWGVVSAVGAALLAAPAMAQGPGPYSNQWDSAGRSRFQHVIEAPPGRVQLTIHATTDAPGGETVAIYPSENGERGRVRIAFVIATRPGASRTAFVTIPRPPQGQTLGRFPIVVDVENAGGRRHAGEYRITVEPQS